MLMADGKKQKHNGYWLYGNHAVEAVLLNPRRKVLRLMMTRASQPRLEAAYDSARHPKPEIVEPIIVRSVADLPDNPALHIPALVGWHFANPA